MGHGTTWITLLPGYDTLNHYFAGQDGFLFGNAVVIQHTVAALLVSVIVLLVAVRTRLDLNRAGEDAVIPDPEPSLRNFVELGLGWFYHQAREIIGDEAPRYFPVIGTLAMFIFFSNLLGLIPGFAPPTDNWNTVFACSIFVFLYYNYHGLRQNGFGHIVHMMNPAGNTVGWFLSPLIFPIEIVSHLARPFSLAVRLSANMIGDHAVLSAFVGLMLVAVPLFPYALGLIVCVVQAVVFVLLTTVYIALAIEDEHHDEHAHEAAHAAA